MKFNEEKFNKYKEIYVKKMMPSSIDGIMLYINAFLCCLFYSLEESFSLNLSVVGGFCAFVTFYEGMYFLCWVCFTLAFAIMQRILDKKKAKDQENKNENK